MERLSSLITSQLGKRYCGWVCPIQVFFSGFARLSAVFLVVSTFDLRKPFSASALDSPPLGTLGVKAVGVKTWRTLLLRSTNSGSKSGSLFSFPSVTSADCWWRRLPWKESYLLTRLLCPDCCGLIWSDCWSDCCGISIRDLEWLLWADP